MDMRKAHWCIPVLLLLVTAPFPSLAQPTAHFAVIGDYGFAGPDEAGVAKLVTSWAPDFVITTGDNNYDDGTDATIDRNIGQYYHSFIFPYKGKFGKGDSVNRFFPSLGNHDYRSQGAAPYLAYFTLPGNERYYDFVKGPVHFFAINSDEHEPDGISDTSVQARWLKNGLAAAPEPWKVVYFHHAPFSTGAHGNSEKLQWPFRDWGASVVITGHDHTYERIVHGSLTYIVNGLGGRSRYDWGKQAEGSVKKFNGDYGALDVIANEFEMDFRFVTQKDSVVDTFSLRATVR